MADLWNMLKRMDQNMTFNLAVIEDKYVETLTDVLGRIDLKALVQAEELARVLFTSVGGKIIVDSDEPPVCDHHFSGVRAVQFRATYRVLRQLQLNNQRTVDAFTSAYTNLMDTILLTKRITSDYRRGRLYRGMQKMKHVMDLPQAYRNFTDILECKIPRHTTAI